MSAAKIHCRSDTEGGFMCGVAAVNASAMWLPDFIRTDRSRRCAHCHRIAVRTWRSL